MSIDVKKGLEEGSDVPNEAKPVVNAHGATVLRVPTGTATKFELTQSHHPQISATGKLIPRGDPHAYERTTGKRLKLDEYQRFHQQAPGGLDPFDDSSVITNAATGFEEIALKLMENNEGMSASELMLKQFSSGRRKELALSGKALPDGSYPIETCGDAKNAREDLGRGGPGKRGEIVAHIAKRENDLGCDNGQLP